MPGTEAGSPSIGGSLTRNLRFFLSLVVPAVLLVGWLVVITQAAARWPGGWGLALAIIGGSSLVLALMLAYWTAVDWLNLRVIRGRLVDTDPRAHDGEVVAVEGVVRVDGEPMPAPFSGTPCAAYTYVLAAAQHSSHRGGARRRVIAQGFHMVPTHIEGKAGSLRLWSLPGFEDELRENADGRKWADEARALTGRLHGTAPVAGERARQSRLLEARHSHVGQVHQDYCMSQVAESVDGLVIDEEVLPAGRTVCVVGTYEDGVRGLSARRPRMGPNLIVYRGTATEVLSRVGKETAGFLKAAAWLAGVGALLLAIPFVWGAS